MKHMRSLVPRCDGGLLTLGLVGALGVCLSVCSRASASSFEGRLYAGPGYMRTSSDNPMAQSSGPAIATQLDAGVKLIPDLAVHGTLIYDYSRWIGLGNDGPYDYVGSMLGFGLGASVRLSAVSIGASAGGQFTWFSETNDPSSGPNGASLGPFISANVGYIWDIAPSVPLGVHVLGRYRTSKDETVSIVFDPSGYQLGLVVSIGLDGEPLIGL